MAASAFPSPALRSCSIRLVSVHLLVAHGFREAVATGQLLRILCLDPEGHYSATTNSVLREQALGPGGCGPFSLLLGCKPGGSMKDQSVQHNQQGQPPVG